jgi:hypothetical protein
LAVSLKNQDYKFFSIKKYIIYFLECKYWHCKLRFDNSTALPGGIRTRDLLFWRQTRWPPCHAARAFSGFVVKFAIFGQLLTKNIYEDQNITTKFVTLSKQTPKCRNSLSALFDPIPTARP